MKLSSLFIITSFIAAVKGDGYTPGENFSTLSPDGKVPDGATTQFTSKFGIAINPITSSVALTSVNTGSEGMHAVTQIGDGQLQAATGTIKTENRPVITQIGDGQIQGSTETNTAKQAINVVTQIGDGQIQATTLTTVTRSSTTNDADVVTTKITKVVKSYVVVPYTENDTASSSTESVETSDKHTSSSSEATSASDEPTTYITVTPTATVTQAITTLNLPTLAPTTVIVEKRLVEETATVLFDKRELPFTCSSDSALTMTLEDSILRDAKGRIGAIVSNRQFQFDGPPPQAGSIYAAGWSIIDGKLALGDSTTFYQCLSGDFYNLYDQSVAPQCTAVELDIILYEDC